MNDDDVYFSFPDIAKMPKLMDTRIPKVQSITAYKWTNTIHSLDLVLSDESVQHIGHQRTT